MEVHLPMGSGDSMIEVTFFIFNRSTGVGISSVSVYIRYPPEPAGLTTPAEEEHNGYTDANGYLILQLENKGLWQVLCQKEGYEDWNGNKILKETSPYNAPQISMAPLPPEPNHAPVTVLATVHGMFEDFPRNTIVTFVHELGGVFTGSTNAMGQVWFNNVPRNYDYSYTLDNGESGVANYEGIIEGTVYIGEPEPPRTGVYPELWIVEGGTEKDWRDKRQAAWNVQTDIEKLAMSFVSALAIIMVFKVLQGFSMERVNPVA